MINLVQTSHPKLHQSEITTTYIEIDIVNEHFTPKTPTIVIFNFTNYIKPGTIMYNDSVKSFDNFVRTVSNCEKSNLIIVNTIEELYTFTPNLFILDSRVWNLPTGINFLNLNGNILSGGNDNDENKIPLINSTLSLSPGNISYDHALYKTFLTSKTPINAHTKDYLRIVTKFDDYVIPLTKNDVYNATMIGIYDNGEKIWLHTQTPDYPICDYITYLSGLHIYDYKKEFGSFIFYNKLYIYIGNYYETYDLTQTKSIHKKFNIQDISPIDNIIHITPIKGLRVYINDYYIGEYLTITL